LRTPQHYNRSLEWLFPQQLDLLQMEVVNPTAGEPGGPEDEDPGTNAINTLLQAATGSVQSMTPTS
jgi:hypothetical protein